MFTRNGQKILVVIDGSYFMYYVLFGAVKNFYKNYRLEHNSLVKPPDETDQTSLPSLLVSDHFKKELKAALIKRCEFIDFILQRKFQDQFDLADSCTFIFALDDYVHNSFRKAIYPEYKAQRKMTKRSYAVSDIKHHITNVLFPELDILGRFGYHTLFVDGAEGDDVIATVLKKFDKDFDLKILFASDHDFCQLENVFQIDLRGNDVTPTVTIKKEKIQVDPKTALLMKIIMGDGADNIPSIGTKIGPKKAYTYATNKDLLKTFLVENSSAAKRFIQNKEIIDFNKIPESLSEKIVSSASRIFKEDAAIKNNLKIDLSLQNIMEL